MPSARMRLLVGESAMAVRNPSATGAPIILDHAANDFAGVVSLTTTSGQVTLRDANALSLASSTINGTFTVTAGGAITQSAGLTVNAPSNFTTTAGDITLSNTGNTFGSVMTLTTATGGNATIDAGSAIILGNVDVGGNLQVSGSGPATLTQDVTAVGNAVFTGIHNPRPCCQTIPMSIWIPIKLWNILG